MCPECIIGSLENFEDVDQPDLSVAFSVVGYVGGWSGVGLSCSVCQ